MAFFITSLEITCKKGLNLFQTKTSSSTISLPLLWFFGPMKSSDAKYFQHTFVMNEDWIRMILMHFHALEFAKKSKVAFIWFYFNHCVLLP